MAKKLSKTSKALVERVVAACKDCGWQEDQGTDSKKMSESAAEYNASLDALRKRILRLERAAEKAKLPPQVSQ